MQTPMKYALGFLALIALTAPVTTAGQATHAHGFVFEGGLMSVDLLLAQANIANACDDTDVGTSVADLAYSILAIISGPNSFPATTVRAGDQGISSSCVAIWGSEQGMSFTIVANGCVVGSPLYATCPAWTKKAADLGTQACFYNGVDAAPIECISDYNTAGDLVGVVPAGAVLMSVDMPVTSSLMSWWMYDGVIY